MPMTPEAMEEMLENLANSQKALTEGLDKMARATQQGQQLLTESLATLTSRLNDSLELDNSRRRSSDDDDGKLPTDVDFETMSRKELVDFIVKGVGGAVDKKMEGLHKGLKEEIDTTRSETNRERLQREVDAMRKEHKDFDDWKEEMLLLVKKNPMLTAKEAYILSRSGDNKKAKELDEKYAKLAKEEAEKNGEGSGKAKGFGGMRPGSGERRTNKTDMTANEAAEAAWDDVFGGHESELLSGELESA